MGNRAVITLDQTPTINSLGIYLHWNGGPESVLAFAQAAHDLGALDRLYCDISYSLARLVQIIGNFTGGTMSVGVDTIGSLDHDNYDNGLFVIHGANSLGEVSLTQYPRGLTGKTDHPRIPNTPRKITYEDVARHPYWKFDEEAKESAPLLQEIKRRNAAPFGGWKNESVLNAAPDLLDALRCAVADLEGALQVHEQMIWYTHDWDAHRQSIEEATAAIAKATE